MTDKESQTDEICALESIFTEEEFKSSSDDGVNGGQFNAFITVSDGFTVVIKDFQEEDKNRDELRISLKFLPPIEIVFTLPPDYPSRAPPWFTISCPWLSRELLSKLCEKLDRLWDENKGSEVLFIWTQFLKEESLSFLSITDTLVLNSCKLEKELKQEKHEKTTKETVPEVENIPDINLSKVEKCDNVGLVSDTSNSHLNHLYTSKSDNTLKDLPQEKFTGASGGVSGHGQGSIYFYNKANQHYQRRRYSNNYGAGKNFDSENNKIPQHTNYYRSENSYVRNNESGFVDQRRNIDRPSSERYENHRRYEKRKPRFVDGRNDHAGYESTKHYNRRKSPVERKISDNLFKKGENSTYSKTESVENVPYESIVHKGNTEDERKTLDSSLKEVENDSIESAINKTESLSRKNTEKHNMESKRMFEKNKKYQKHYNEGNSKETVFTSDSRPRRMFKTGESYNGSQSYNNRYQNRSRGKNTDSRKGRFNNNILNDTKVETLVENLSINKIKDSADKIDVVSDVCETNLENVDKLIQDCADIKKDRIGRCQNRQKHLHLFLKDYNKDRMKMEFMRKTYTCNICFLDKLGMECTQFSPCEHVFCRECVTGYLEVRIKDGAVHNIMCPDNKCSSEAIPSQVRELVSPELFARYDSILLSTTLDTMCDIIYCPRPSCQYPTSKEEGSKMARCPSCKYAFCIYCRMVYHGVEACRFKNAEKKVICDEYQNADDEKKLFMEQKYGKKQLMVLLQTMMSETWIIDNSKKCPHCNSAIEKSDGCNKMVCGKCNTFFCWLCGVRLDPVVPYKHYYDSKSRCYNLLFQGMQYEDNDDINDDDEEDDDQLDIL